ncbi:MAG: bifunctional proline dehydrogenase/L-glutamate gamma-semialdehyde dehydrogenase, partial [Lentisphaeraceae bacterium]|nr:bifunctional proline dehydrogenase/L-glutamate gamma-semialdehyde dehydrogenase [Lentisphaeraceae bacterium]
TKPENAQAVNIGVASHNLFDISYAMLLVAENGVEKQVNFEMLEGMAEHIRKVVQELSHGIILYCPAAEKHEFQHAIAYLIRRLDENTSPENFLRHAFNLVPGTEKFREQAQFFLDGCKIINEIEQEARRKQNRLEEAQHLDHEKPFANEADTDFCLPANREWANNIYRDYGSFEATQSPIVINGEKILTENTKEAISPNTAKAFSSYSLADETHIKTILNCANEESKTWSKKDPLERCRLVKEIAKTIRNRRAELIKIMMLETGKHLAEADVEVSEAVDFCEYYGRTMEEWLIRTEFTFSPLGPVLVTPPWNFPCAIPLGGIIASLVTGNTVIFKPAPEATLTGWHLAKAIYDSGISKKVLQFVSCEDSPQGSLLVKDDRIKACILTGATETAKLFKKLNPSLNLMAETGGKNSIIVSDLSDRDLAIKDIVQSAFGHAGQKCSACSLAILEKNVYEDKKFLNTLKDAAASLKVAPSNNPVSKVNPLINKPEGKLLKALTILEEDEEWLHEPKQDSQNSHLWSPGIKLGVKPGSFTFTTEFFGPVLGLVKAESVEDAVKMANSSKYGLTGGIHSLDDREKNYWLQNIEVGNAYINRTITGAIVRRQAFGGLKNSSFGRGFKAGGPNYLLQLMNIEEITYPKEINNAMSDYSTIKEILTSLAPREVQSWEIAVGSYLYNLENFFQKKDDPSQVTGQENYLKYSSVDKVQFFVRGSEEYLDIYRVIAASLVCKSPIEVICTQSSVQKYKLDELKLEGFTLITASEEEQINLLADADTAKVRLIHTLPQEWQEKAAEKFVSLQPNPVYSSGRLELLNYLKSTSVSDNFHRYGNLGSKSQ